jgi:hypothetical protein
MFKATTVTDCAYHYPYSRIVLTIFQLEIEREVVVYYAPHLSHDTGADRRHYHGARSRIVSWATLTNLSGNRHWKN